MYAIEALFSDFIGDDCLVAIGKAGRVLEYDLRTGREVARFEGMKFGTSIKASPDGKRVAVSTSDERLAMYSRSGKLLYRIKIGSEVRRLAWSPDRSLIAMAHHRSHLAVCESESGKEVRRVEAGWVGEVDAVGSNLVLIDRVLTDDMYPKFQVFDWELNLVREAVVLPACPNHSGISSDFSRLWSVFNDEVATYETDGSEVSRFEVPGGVTVSSAALSPTAREMALVSNEGDILRVDSSSGEVIGREFLEFATTCEFSPSGNWLMVNGMKKGGLIRLEANV